MSKITHEKFDTYKNVFDEFTIRNIFKLSSEGFFESMVSPISMGKEANLFTAEKADGTKVIVKIYRLENCNFNKMYDYIKQDPRYDGLKDKRREIIFAWTQREYRNLSIAREVIRVPTPYKFYYNILVMELIGTNDDPASMLKDCDIKAPQEYFDKIIECIKRLYKAGLVHGDLSQFNILIKDEEPVFIDFSQATITTNNHALELLSRDVKNIITFFTKFGVKADLDLTLQHITKIDDSKNDSDYDNNMDNNNYNIGANHADSYKNKKDKKSKLKITEKFQKARKTAKIEK